ncbi:MAG: murein L,D-transpeptidase family protein [Tenuifilaceae bacterium]
MKKIYKKLLIISLAACFIALTVFFLFKLIPNPPIKEVDQAREALSIAVKSRASTYSSKLYSEAKVYYDSAMVNWKRENERFIYFRKYDKVVKYAKLSTKKAKQANDKSNISTKNYKSDLKNKIISLNKLETDINNYFNRYPLPDDIRKNISKGRLLLKEGEVEYNKGQYITANQKLNKSEELLSSAYNKASSDLENYFKSYSLWKKWSDNAITESKNNKSYAIIVDKLSKKCFVYYNGTKKYEFDVELGINWVGDKRKMGDKATPEGVYKIINKLSRTKYNNALLINYPNSEDNESFKREKSKGLLPRTAKIGGGIEIHGSGGKGVDWTEGCIALLDSEMEIIYNIATIGTPVTIVGSMKNLNQILKR